MGDRPTLPKVRSWTRPPHPGSEGDDFAGPAPKALQNPRSRGGDVSRATSADHLDPPGTLDELGTGDCPETGCLRNAYAGGTVLTSSPSTIPRSRSFASLEK